VGKVVVSFIVCEGIWSLMVAVVISSQGKPMDKWTSLGSETR